MSVKYNTDDSNTIVTVNRFPENMKQIASWLLFYKYAAFALFEPEPSGLLFSNQEIFYNLKKTG